MKLLRSSNAFIAIQNLTSIFKYSPAAYSSTTRTPTTNSLYFRVTHDVDRKISIAPILENWIDEGKSVEKAYLQGMVKKLRKIKRHAHALEVCLVPKNNVMEIVMRFKCIEVAHDIDVTITIDSLYFLADLD